ncbi:MAG: DUF4405 domain-containing protein [Prevotella sp.]|jgi:cytochrome c biogenesis protein CcdA|nr:DUF4405 domain-containing protein [Prevotella sp.]
MNKKKETIMGASQEKAFNRRKFISIGLFLTFVVVVVTAIVIQIFEAIEEDFFIHLFTVIHIFSGLAFTILSVFHAKLNWNAMKSYAKEKGAAISREAVYAFLLTMAAILICVLFVCFVMD